MIRKMVMSKHYDIIVVGGGHAGCEAALAASRMGCETLLFNINLDSVALSAAKWERSPTARPSTSAC